MQQATFKETKSCEGHFLVVFILCGKASEPILVCSLINLRGSFKALMQIARSWPRRVTSYCLVSIFPLCQVCLISYCMLLLGKVEYGGGPIFKVVLEC